MAHLKVISELLIGLDLDTADGGKAGPPFELPYGLTLPEREKDRWRHHLDVVTAARRLAVTLEGPAAPDGSREQVILKGLAERDSAALAVLAALRQGSSPPAVTGFAKVQQILDEGLRGLALECFGHNEFWHTDEGQFIAAASAAGLRAVKPGDGARSNLVLALRGDKPFGSDTGTPGGGFRRMPGGRAPIDPTRIDFIKQWIERPPCCRTCRANQSD